MSAHIVTKLADRTWHIGELKKASVYLLEGDREALLIDTALGVGDLPQVIRELTALPVKVVLTHAHQDHAGGIGHFDEVYVHGADLTSAAMLTTEDLDVFVKANFPGQDHPVQPVGVTHFHMVGEGYVFDLGGRKVTVHEAPGHTLGSVVLTDDQTGFLFSGDACNPGLLLALPGFLRAIMPKGTVFASVETCLHTLEKIRAMDYTANYTGHFDELGMQPAPKTVADDLIAICKRILTGTVGPEDAAPVPLPMDDEFRCLMERMSMLAYSPLKYGEEYML